MIREQNAQHLPREARAAVIIEDGDQRMVYLLRSPITLSTEYEYAPTYGTLARPLLVGATMTVEGQMIEGRIWTGDMPTAEPTALEPNREEITDGH